MGSNLVLIESCWEVSFPFSANMKKTGINMTKIMLLPVYVILSY